jgi:sugar O-acyltransferase (sialic acid O-acetyltransferase NeuD family)
MNNVQRRKLIILGAGAFAEEIADIAAGINGCEVAAFVEGIDRDRCQEPLLGLPVYWIADIGPLAQTCEAVCAVGSPEREIFIRQAADLGMRFASLIHPSAHVSPTVSLGAGVIVSAGAIIAAQTMIGRHVIVNRGCLIGHHVRIGDYATLSPGANIAGGVTIDDAATVGMGAIVLDHLTIGAGSFVGAGSVVTKDVPAHVQVVGVPARVVKELKRES